MLQKIVIGSCSALMFVALLTGCQKMKKGDDGLTAQQWNALVSRNLPSGTSRADVEKFLDQHGVEHSYIANSNFPGEANSIVALVKSRDDSGLVKKSGVQIKFKFDADQRLVSSESKDLFTGP